MASKFMTAGVIAATAIVLAGCSTIRNRLPGNNAANPTKVSGAVKSSPQLGVNSFLWRASLETLNFMPLQEVDPFGGVIITDWYASAEAPGERFKSNVYILDTQLRADALKVSVFKQLNQGGGWSDAPVDADTARQIENAILTRARELYIASN